MRAPIHRRIASLGAQGVALCALATACASETAPMAATTARMSEPRTTPAPLESTPVQDVVARWEGGSISGQQLEARIGDELQQRQIRFMLEQYEAKARAIDVLVMESLIADEVKRRGLSDADALLRSEVEDKVPEPTDAEVADFWPVVERQFRGATLEEARPAVVAQLVRRARSRRYGAFVSELREASGLRLELPYPNLPKANVEIHPHDPTIGPADAPVTIVQFAEYQCYFCNEAKPRLEQIMAKYDGKVRLVWKDYPLSNHGRAMPAAVAAHCAGEQGQYWEMSKLLLANQHAVSDADVAGYAMDLNLKAEPFQACMTSGRQEPIVQEDLRQGKALDVRSTPTFFVNGVVVFGAQPYALFESLVERELAAAAE